jgi:hypothetical protein
VYCGSSDAVDPKFRTLAHDFGALLADRGHELVYGGGRTGLMGAVADGALSRHGRVTGVIPLRIRDHEVAHLGLSELVVVDGMHARKQIMCGLSDAFVALPGAFGTLDELFEAVTWNQLGYHDKPCALLDPFGYFDDLVRFLDRAHAEKFCRDSTRALLFHESDPVRVLERLAAVPRRA